jgi:hypothetical protein
MEQYQNHSGGYMGPKVRTEIAKEVRATHFKLGGHGPSYQSQYGQNFAPDRQNGVTAGHKQSTTGL